MVCLVVGLAQPGSLGAVAAGTASASLGRNDPFGVLGPGAADPDRPDAEGTGLLLRGDGSTAVLTELQQGVVFFALLRSLVLTGYYTTQMGIESLGYQGNISNIWDGVPEDVLANAPKTHDGCFVVPRVIE